MDIAPWGLVILALFLLTIGFEEILFANEDLVSYQYVPGALFLVFGAVMFIIALLAYWNGKKQYCMLFLWIAIIAPIVGLIVGFEGAINKFYFDFYVGTRGVTYGIAIALITFLIGVWTYFQKGVNKHIPVLLFCVGIFALLEGLANNYIELVYVDILQPAYITSDGFKPLKIGAGVFAILAGLVAAYIGFIKPELIDKKAKKRTKKDNEPIKSFDVRAIGTVIVTFSLILMALNGIMYAKDGFDYQIMPGFFVMLMGLALMFISILAYWHGDKNNVFIFIWTSIFLILAGFLCGMDNALIDQYIDVTLYTSGGMPFFVVDKGLPIGIIFCVLTLILALWSYFNKKLSNLTTAFLVLVAIAGLLIGISTTCLVKEDLSFIFPISVVTELGEGFTTYKIVSGLLLLVAALIAVYEGIIKNDIMGKVDYNRGTPNLKTVDVSAIGMFVVALFLITAGISGIVLFKETSLDDYFFSPKLYFGIAMIFTTTFMLLSFWNGNKVATVFMLIITIFCMEMLISTMSNRYGAVPTVILLLFLIAAMVWMYKNSDRPILITVFFGILTLAALIVLIGAIFSISNGDIKEMDAISMIVVAIAGVLLTYISFAKMNVVKLPIA